MSIHPSLYSRFIRTRRTWQAYFSNSYYSFFINALGPLIIFLREDLDLTYTQASFHFTVFALGVIVISLLLNPAVKRFGARQLVWVGVAGLSLGALLLMIGERLWITIFGAFLMGMLGVLIAALVSAALAEQHGAHRAVALTEATMIASLAATLAPMAIGFFGRTPLTWRGGLGLALLAAPVLWLVYKKDNLVMPKAEPPLVQESRARTGLPALYWLYWMIIFLALAVEFCITFWAADYLEKVTGLSKANAALGLSVFMGGLLVGRVLISRLLMRSKEQRLLIISLGVATAGFLLFWLAPIPALALFGLAVTGLGVAGTFPILNALALSTVPERMIEGSAKVTLAMGLAILLFPISLGRLADWVGIRSAYGLELGLLTAAIVLTLFAMRAKRPVSTTV